MFVLVLITIIQYFAIDKLNSKISELKGELNKKNEELEKYKSFKDVCKKAKKYDKDKKLLKKEVKK